MAGFEKALRAVKVIKDLYTSLPLAFAAVNSISLFLRKTACVPLNVLKMATEVEKSLSDNLKFAKYFVKDADDSPNAIQNLLALVEGNILIWTEIKNTVLSVPLNDVIRLGPNEPYSAQLLRHVYQRQSKENVTEKYAAGPRVQVRQFYLD